MKKSLNCRKTHATELDLICVVTTLSSLTIGEEYYFKVKIEALMIFFCSWRSLRFLEIRELEIFRFSLLVSIE